MGCPAKARQKLSWTAEIEFPALVAEMVQHDLYYAFGTVRPS